jgi:Ca2+-binding RTX toxin-like protein
MHSSQRFLLWLLGLVAVSAVSMVAIPSEPAQAKRLVGTHGADRLHGSAKPDLIKGRAGNDRINGRQGADRLIGSRGKDRIKGAQGRDRILGGKGADRLNAADGKRDRAVKGGPGTDTCKVDAADRSAVDCEKVKVVSGGGPYGQGGGGAGGGGADGGDGDGAGANCAVPVEPRLNPAAETRSSAPVPPEPEDDAPPTFSPAFYTATVTLDASVDGVLNGQLPISIEGVCDVPKALQAEAAQLIGGDGVAIVGPTTSVFQGTTPLQGPAATTALEGADTVSITARLMQPGRWAQDEDGSPVPTFDAIRIDITD